jgi:enterochelin esterase-like enzyme
MRFPTLSFIALTLAASTAACSARGSHDAFLVAAFAPAATRTAPATPVATDSVDFVRLRTSSSQRDCSPTEPTAPLCRVRRSVDRRMLESMLVKGTHVAQFGDELTFVQRSNAKTLEVTGGLQYPMSRVVGTDIFTVTLRAYNFDRAVVSYSFYSPDEPLKPGTRMKSAEWRGATAPPPAFKSVKVQGSVRVDTLPSRFLSSPRAVHSYVPPARGNEPIAGVVYMGDGSALTGIAPYVDTLIVTGRLPRVMLVGIPTGDAGPKDPPGTDVRAMEYLLDFEPGNARFLANERFVFDEVIPWAEATLGAPRTREQRAIWGISNSGAWATDMGLRHADALGAVLAFSPGGAHGRMPPGASFTPSVRFLLQGGTLEPAFRKIAADWSDSLRTRGVTHTYREVIAGHDWLVWCEQFPAAIRWAWGRVEQ